MRGLRSLFRRDREPLPDVDVMQFEALARKRLSRMAYDFVRCGGADEITMRENRLAFERIRLSPRVLVDVSELDTRLTLLGTQLDFPILLGPVGFQRLFHRDGELETARAANRSRTLMVVSSFATTSIEQIAGETRNALWYQLYVSNDRGLTRGNVQRAVAAGYKAICLTVDTPVLGPRYNRLEFSLPDGIEAVDLRGMSEAHAHTGRTMHRSKIYEERFDPTLSWRDLDWLRSTAGIPILLKGVLNPDDASRAIDNGIDGLIVSNHGGRNLDRVPAAIDALPRVTAAVAGRIPVLLDSGVRRGTDIVAALALGASAVLIGRPYIYGLAARGAEGIERVVAILREELERAMALTGRRSLAELDSSVIWPAQRDEARRPALASSSCE
jgi:4-hydroxymandelate oxidase